MSEEEPLDPGLQGYSDSGSDFHDMPEPELPPGIRKTILEPAPESWTLKRPLVGDEVAIRCSGAWKGTGQAFAAPSGLEDGEGFTRFTIGKGEIMRGVDLAVTTMRVGEVAKFEFAAAFAEEAEGGSSSSRDSGRVSSAFSLKPVLALEVGLVHWTVRCDLFEDGTAIKSVLQRGDDRRRPIIGQVCLLSLALPAQKWERCSFEHVIEDMAPPGSDARGGWRLLDRTLLAMRRGERSEVRCSADLLLEGAPAGLFPASIAPTGGTCILEVELSEFIETSDISFETDGRLIKRSLRSRDAWVQCQDGGRCDLKVQSVQDGSGNILGQDSDEITFTLTIGSGDVCDAFECAAASMREGEVAEVTCSCREHCCEPRLRLQGAASVTFRLEVATYVPGRWDEARGDAAKLEVLSARKANAVELFKAGRHQLAAYQFGKVHELLGYIDDFRGVRGGEAQKKQVAELKKLCLLNRALCLIKVSNFKAALKACNTVLEDESCNMKALLRRAQAYLGLDDCPHALSDAKAVLCTEPGSRDARRLVAEIKERQKVLDVSSKGLFVKMCDGLGHLPHPLDVD